MMDRINLARGRRCAIAASFGLALLLGACGGGSDSDDSQAPPPPATDNGVVMVSMTDAEGDFMRYAVTVESLTLERQDGAVVEALPASAMVDLAQLVEVTELLSTVTVPAGTYSAAHLRIDYSDADIAVESNGETVEAVVVDGEGTPLTTADVDVTFDNVARLVVRPGLPALLAIDFDLAASNTVDLTTTPATVTAEPFLLASVNPADGKTVHVGGQLTAAASSAASFTVDLRPFHRRDGVFGEVSVQVDDATTYEIDGTPLAGAAGLEALAALPEGAPVLAEATINVDERALVGIHVLAGGSVPGADLDAVEGLVTQRDGDLLQVRGAVLVRKSGEVSFGDDVAVTLAADVTVRQRGNPDPLDSAAVSVGQRIVAMGTLNLDDPSVPALEASTVRLKETHVSGEVSGVQAGSLVMSVDAVDVRSPSNFDYTGTGTSAETDADPSAYEIDTGSLELADIVEGTPVRVFGFAAPFGAAPPDFLADTVVDVTNASWRMDVHWPEGSTAAFASLEAGSIVLDLSDPGLGAVHHLRRGGVLTDLLTLPAAPAITGNEEGLRLYGILQNGAVQVFLDFDRFAEELVNRMGSSAAVVRVHAVGAYDEGGNTLAATRVAVQLE